MAKKSRLEKVIRRMSRVEKEHYNPQMKWYRRNVTAILTGYKPDARPAKEQADDIINLLDCIHATYELRHE